MSIVLCFCVNKNGNATARMESEMGYKVCKKYVAFTISRKQRLASCNYGFSEHFGKMGWNARIMYGVPGKIERRIWRKILDTVPFSTTYSSHFKMGKKEQTILLKWDNNIYKEVLLRTAYEKPDNTYNIVNGEC